MRHLLGGIGSLSPEKKQLADEYRSDSDNSARGRPNFGSSYNVIGTDDDASESDCGYTHIKHEPDVEKTELLI